VLEVQGREVVSGFEQQRAATRRQVWLSAVRQKGRGLPRISKDLPGSETQVIRRLVNTRVPEASAVGRGLEVNKAWSRGRDNQGPRTN